MNTAQRLEALVGTTLDMELYRSLKPTGRLLLQQMSRRADAAPGGGAFIESYIAPDMHMRPVAQTFGPSAKRWFRGARRGSDARTLRAHC